MTTIYIPTINDTDEDFDRLFEVYQQLVRTRPNVEIDFSRCGFLRQNAVAFIGGVIRLLEHRGVNLSLKLQGMQPQVYTNLEKNGFLEALGGTHGPQLGNTIPFREDRAAQVDKVGIVDYLKSKWLGRGWLHVSNRLRDAIVGKVWEIYANAFEHGASPVGLFSCGQYFPRLHVLNLTVVDFGIGIPFNVRQFASSPTLGAHKAMEWAFKPGTTTKPNGMGRGVGLDLMKQFVAINKGKLEVFSHDGHAIIDSTGERYLERACHFDGTLVNISLKCDESYYCFSSEVSQGPLF